MAIVLQERTVQRGLLMAAALVSLVGLVVEVIHHLIPSASSPILPMFSLSVESNFPTWYSSLLLFACGILLFTIAAGTRQAQNPFPQRWTLLGAVFLFMSLDEAVELHENLHLGSVELHGVLYFSWVIPAGIIVVLLGLSYLPFLKHLDPKTRKRFILSGLIYVGGALVLELPLGWWADRAGRDNLVYGLIDWVEETLEIFGATLFLLSLFGYLREHYGELRIAAQESP